MFAAQDGSTPNGKLYSDSVFSTYLYTGNGSTQTINNGIDLAGKGGLVWIKRRSPGGYEHGLYDTVRGATKSLISHSTAAQQTYADTLTGFDSSGFTVGSDFTYGFVNESAAPYVSWTFRKAPKFFDVVTGTTNSNGQATISHSLGIEPGMVIFKTIGVAGNWYVYHRSLGTSAHILLNTTAASPDVQVVSSVSSSSVSITNMANSASYVAYLFAHDPSTDGIIQCGSFTGSSSSAVDVNLGWEPQWLLIKRTNSSAAPGWWIGDVMRGLNMSGISRLEAQTAAAESAAYDGVRPTATGFSLPYGTVLNDASSSTYIYLAIRRPNKPPTTGTEVYNAIARTGTGAAATVTGIGFAPDLFLSGDRSTGNAPSIFIDKLRGVNKELAGWFTGAEYAATGSVTGFENNSVTLGANTDSLGVNVSGINYIEWMFRRAPGFFDVVAYKGLGADGYINHNLGTSPEIIVIKARGYTSHWAVYSAATGAGGALLLNDAGAYFSSPSYWRNISPSVASFHIGTAPQVNGSSSDNFIAYLFATLPGISKVGSYTGNGTSQTINCGFTTGARFILIKRTDSTGDWYVWDSVRGIVAANDPHLSLNTTAAEVTTDDSVDPDASGFIVNQNTATNINVSGGSYIFLAIS